MLWSFYFQSCTPLDGFCPRLLATIPAKFDTHTTTDSHLNTFPPQYLKTFPLCSLTCPEGTQFTHPSRTQGKPSVYHLRATRTSSHLHTLTLFPFSSPTSSLPPQVSYTSALRSLNLPPQVSHLRYHLPTFVPSSFNPQPSALSPQPSALSPPTSGLPPPTSGLPPQVSHTSALSSLPPQVSY